jgi:hypothetical protein
MKKKIVIIFCEPKGVYSHIKKTSFTNNYQHYESEIDKHIKSHFTEEKEYNEKVVEQ